ncbi:hypothetical protein B0H14DRAFT_2588958 [Mycena olivaceomarginata]|nr:hypothetical protein B0H14DRAFT_2588958 [Mycena olivaceomarginata]
MRLGMSLGSSANPLPRRGLNAVPGVLVSQFSFTSFLKLAKSLGIYAVWIQPGAEDDAVVEFIEADAQLKAQCVYRKHPLHTTTPSPMAMLAADTTLHTDVLGPWLFSEPTVSATNFTTHGIECDQPLFCAEKKSEDILLGLKFQSNIEKESNRSSECLLD